MASFLQRKPPLSTLTYLFPLRVHSTCLMHTQGRGWASSLQATPFPNQAALSGVHGQTTTILRPSSEVVQKIHCVLGAFFFGGTAPQRSSLSQRETVPEVRACPSYLTGSGGGRGAGNEGCTCNHSPAFHPMVGSQSNLELALLWLRLCGLQTVSQDLFTTQENTQKGKPHATFQSRACSSALLNYPHVHSHY